MKQNKNDADPSAPSDEFVVQPQTLRRLQSIRKTDESYDDAITRLLDAAIEHVPIEELLEELLTQVEDAVSIGVDVVPDFENPTLLLITVHTGDAESEEVISLYDGQETRTVIETQAGDQFALPFEIIATCDGPKSEMLSTTPVYATDTILGMDAVTLDAGIQRLQLKIGKTQEEVHQLLNRSRIDQSR